LIDESYKGPNLENKKAEAMLTKLIIKF